jgi:hypothetical protein
MNRAFSASASVPQIFCGLAQARLKLRRWRSSFQSGANAPQKMISKEKALKTRIK